MPRRRNHDRPRYQALLHVLRTAETLWNASRVFFAHWDLSPSQFNILNLLHQKPEGMTQIELSRELIMHRSNVTGLVDRLQTRRLVNRQADSADRRVHRVVLTGAAEKMIREILPAYYDAAEKIWGAFPARNATRLADELATLRQNVERFTAASKPPRKQTKSRRRHERNH